MKAKENKLTEDDLKRIEKIVNRLDNLISRENKKLKNRGFVWQTYIRPFLQEFTEDLKEIIHHEVPNIEKRFEKIVHDFRNWFVNQSKSGKHVWERYKDVINRYIEDLEEILDDC